MKLARNLFTVACICSVFAASAAADGLVRLTSSDFSFVTQEETDPSPSDIVPQPDLLSDGKDYGCGCEKAGKDCCCEPWELFPETCRGVKIGGWLQAGYHTEGANGLGVASVPLVNPTFNNYPNVVQLHQAYIYAEKAAETYGCGWDWGFRLDYVYGTDGQDTQAMGSEPGNWDTTWDNGNFYGHAIPQMYMDVAYNNVTVRMGHFYTILGYERVTAPDNFFYSHGVPFIMQPKTHTGVLAEWEYTDRLTLYAGWTQGWDTGFDGNGGDAFLGGFSLQLTDALSFSYITSMGDFAYATVPPQPGSDSDGYMHSIVFDWDVTDRLNYVVHTDYLDNGLYTGGAGPILSVNQYLIYTINDCWAIGGRADWVRADATRIEFIDATIGANYRPHPNVLIRPELRLDDFDAATGLQDSTVFGIDAIFTF